MFDTALPTTEVVDLPLLRRFRPTDGHPLLHPDDCDVLGDWRIFPVQQSVLSSMEEISNYETALAAIGGRDNPDVAVVSLRHWMSSTIDVIAVRPGSEAERILKRLAARLTEHPVLDDADLSRRQAEDFEDRWVGWAAHEFASGIVRSAEQAGDDALTEEVREWLLWDVSAEDLASLYRIVSCGRLATIDLASEVTDAGRHLHACLGIAGIVSQISRHDTAPPPMSFA